MKIAYAAFLAVSLIFGGRFLYQLGFAVRAQYCQRPGPDERRTFTVQEIRFAPVTLNPLVQGRIEQLRAAQVPEVDHSSPEIPQPRANPEPR